MQRSLRFLSVSTALAAAAVTAVAVSPSTGAQAPAGVQAPAGAPAPTTAHDHRTEAAAAAPRPGAVEAQLAAVRASTAQYHRVETALADGYRAAAECVASPDGVMGVHYVHPDRLTSIDPQRPAMLLYVPGPDGPRLAGVEYFQADADQDLSTDDDRPALFGHPFDGPMPGHSAGMPAHYDLHVWLWAHNPAGTFAPWNPALSC